MEFKALRLASDITKRADVHCVHALHEPFRTFLGPETRADLVSQEQRECMRLLEREIEVLKEHSTGVHQFHIVMRIGEVRSVIGNSICE